MGLAKKLIISQAFQASHFVVYGGMFWRKFLWSAIMPK